MTLPHVRLIRWGASLSKSTATHKATKAALTQLTRSLAEELQEAGPRLARLVATTRQLRSRPVVAAVLSGPCAQKLHHA